MAYTDIGWCRCYSAHDGKIQYTINEGQVNGIMIDGKYDAAPSNDRLKEIWKQNFPADIENDWDEYQNLPSYADSKQLCCENCPWHDDCDAWRKI